jgi:hypothetical protein
LAVLVAVHASVVGLYLPPVLKSLLPSYPPQVIISLPLQIAVCERRAEGALFTFVANQLSVLGLYLAPVLKYVRNPSYPPHTIISLPVHTAV